MTKQCKLVLVTVLFSALSSVAGAQTSTLMWDEPSSPAVTGYSLTVDGVRTDYHLQPAAANGTCGCALALPVSGGRHTIVVGAYNAAGETLSAPLVVAPSANAAGPYAAQAGSAVAVSASGSSDPSGMITSYSWNWGDGASTQTASAQSSHIYTTAGTYTITLTIADNGGATATATTTAAISSVPPASAPSTPSTPLPASGSANISTFPVLPTLTWSASGATSYTVNFGTTNPPPQAATGLTSASYAPLSLAAGTSYFWQVVARNAAGTNTGPVWSFTTASPVTSSPFSGTPAPIPGQILMANFDNGGEGVAYHDTTAGNTGGVYRNTDVDLQPSSDGFYNIGWIFPGEWVNYTVNVAAAGNYNIALKVASLNGASMHVSFNGPSAVSSQSIAVPVTGAWQTWTTVNIAVRLAAGVQQMTLSFDAGNMNIESATVTALSSGGTSAGSGSGSTLSPFSGTPAPIPGQILMANFDNGGEGVAYHDTTPGNTGGVYRNTDVDLQPSSDGFYNIGWIFPGEWLNYTVNVATAGSYNIALKVASLNGASMHVSFNGPSAVSSQSIAVPVTGAWQTWTTVNVAVKLAAGVQQMTLSFDAGNMNIESATVTAVSSGGTGGGSGSGSTLSTPFSGMPAPIPGQILMADFDNGGEGVAYHDTTPGNTGGVYRNTDVDLQPSSDGFYNIGWIFPGEWVNYTVNVAAAGSYNIALRVSSLNGASLHVSFNGPSAVTSPSIAVPVTGAWQTWTTVNVAVTLAAGVQQMTLSFDAGNMNIESATVTAASSSASSGSSGTLSPFSGAPVPIPGQILMANFDNGGEGAAYHDTTPGNTGGAYRNTDVDLEASSEGGYNVGWVDAGEWLRYTVNVSASGNYTVQFRVASLSGGAALHVGFNGPSALTSTSVPVPSTGNWETWTTVTVPVTLSAGTQQMTIYFDNPGLNILWANVIPR